ncbi:MAG: Na+/H+ antiporter subunit E [Burkholderiales bacterium]|nr:Na+/H+ antiporter subunit E [Burkholderiales bacterium]
MRPLVLRTLSFLLLWVLLMGGAEQLAFGVAAAALAAWCSMRLREDGQPGLRLSGLWVMAPRFLWQSLIAGVDVALRAFRPRLRLDPGLVSFRPRLPPGSARSLFTAYTSLLPGTVPCGEIDGAVVYHCLDVGQPIVAQLTDEETRLARALQVELAP